MKPKKSVDDYINGASLELQAKLQELRDTIKSVVPEAKESISYGMPYYSYKGKLVYFQLSSKHIGVYFPTPTVSEFKKELEGYSISTATIRFPLDKKLPVGLIKRMIKARAKRNEELKAKSSSKIN